MAQFTNQAQLRYGNTIANSNVATGEITEILSAAKTAVGANYSQGDKITYIVSLVNTGSTDVTGLTLSDNLGAYTFNALELTPLSYTNGSVKYYQNGTLQTAPAVTVGPPMTISGITVPAGGNALVIYEATANEYAPLAAVSTITNTVTITGTGITSITASETVTAESVPSLTITKAISPVPVAENGRLTYTFTIQNYGNAEVTADTGAVITDTFNPILSDLSVSFNGTAWTAATSYTYTAAGEFATVAGQIIVPAATYTQDATTGAWTTNPGVSVLTVSGTV